MRHTVATSAVEPSSSAANIARFRRQPINMQVSSAHSGNSRLPDTKSTTSNTVLPASIGIQSSGRQFASTLNESTEQMPASHAANTLVTAAGPRRIPRACNQATPGSNPARVGVSEAKISNTKKIVPMKRPPGMSANAVGNTSKTNAGPPAGSMWKRNTNGNTSNVASTE